MNEMDKKIYEYCKKVNWETEKISNFAKELGMSPEEVIIRARKSQMTIEKIERLIVLNPVLLELKNKKTYLMWENDDEKEIVLKYIYEYCERNLYRKEMVERLSIKFGFGTSLHKILKYAKEYAIDYLKMSKEEYSRRRHEYGRIKQKEYKKNIPGGTKIIYQKLIEAKSLDEIVNIIETSDYNLSLLRSSLADYIIVHHNGDGKIENIIKMKLNMYSQHKQKKAQEERKTTKQVKKDEEENMMLPIAIYNIKLFLSDTTFFNTEEFCKKNKIDRKKFEIYVELIKEKDPSLYQLYIDKITNMQKNVYAIVVNKINLIVKLLNQGIEENGMTRPFDLLDYYSITKMEFDNILKIAGKSLNAIDYKKLKIFILRNMSSEKTSQKDIAEILKEKVEINCQKNENGIPILGTGEIFSEENKLKIIEYLKQNHIPVNRKTYTLVFRRYVNGSLELDNHDNKTR